nr:MAG TPA: lysozyme [Caudoviricetes sp.]
MALCEAEQPRPISLSRDLRKNCCTEHAAGAYGPMQIN